MTIVHVMEFLINASHRSQLQLMGLDTSSLFHIHLHFFYISNCAEVIKYTENVDNSIFISIIMSLEQKKKNRDFPVIVNKGRISKASKRK